MTVYEVLVYQNSDEQVTIGHYTSKEVAEVVRQRVRDALNAEYGTHSRIGVWLYEHQVHQDTTIDSDILRHLRDEYRINL